jgi:hypothetical protein
MVATAQFLSLATEKKLPPVVDAVGHTSLSYKCQLRVPLLSPALLDFTLKQVSSLIFEQALGEPCISSHDWAVVLHISSVQICVFQIYFRFLSFKGRLTLGSSLYELANAV